MSVALLLLTLAAHSGDVHPGDALWNALQPLCGKSFEGRLVEEPSRPTRKWASSVW